MAGNWKLLPHWVFSCLCLCGFAGDTSRGTPTVGYAASYSDTGGGGGGEEVEETCPAEAQEHEQGNLLDFVSITMGKDEEEEAEETCPAEAPSSTSVETVPALEDKGDSAKEKATKHSHAKESAGKKAQLLRSIQEAKEKRAAAKERIEAIKHRAGAEVPTTTPQSKVEKMPENDGKHLSLCPFLFTDLVSGSSPNAERREENRRFQVCSK